MQAHIVFGIPFLGCLYIVRYDHVANTDGVKDMRVNEWYSPLAEVKEDVNLILPTAYSKILVGGCLRIEDEETALGVMSVETAELVEVTYIVTAFSCLVDYTRVVIGELISEAIDFIKEHYTSLCDSLLK